MAVVAEGGCGSAHADRNAMGTEDPDVVSIKAPIHSTDGGEECCGGAEESG